MAASVLPVFRCAALLFDVDGVLVASTGSVARVWRRWAQEHGLDAEAVIAMAHGRRSIETIQRVAPQLDAESENARVEQMEIDDTAGLAPIPGAREALATVPPDRVALVTSGTRALATARLKFCKLRLPRVLVTADDVAAGKPDPMPYRIAAERLGIEPGRCLVFEDTPAGIQSGHANGMPVIALNTTYPAVELAEADAIVASLAEVRIHTLGEGEERELMVQLLHVVR